MRARQKMFAIFEARVPTNRETRVVDVGVTPERTTTSNNFFEALYPWKDRITATSIEDAAFMEQEYPGLTFVRTGAAGLPFDDRAFDVVFSSAVLEHVGDQDQQRRFVHDLVRVGERFFITTPNRWFPVDLHTALPFLHWAPRRQHQWALRRLGRDFWASTENLNLLSASQFLALFPTGVEVTLVRFRTAGLTSNLIAYGRHR